MWYVLECSHWMACRLDLMRNFSFLFLIVDKFKISMVVFFSRELCELCNPFFFYVFACLFMHTLCKKKEAFVECYWLFVLFLLIFKWCLLVDWSILLIIFFCIFFFRKFSLFYISHFIFCCTVAFYLSKIVFQSFVFFLSLLSVVNRFFHTNTLFQFESNKNRWKMCTEWYIILLILRITNVDEDMNRRWFAGSVFGFRNIKKKKKK